mgnify:CR=1
MNPIFLSRYDYLLIEDSFGNAIGEGRLCGSSQLPGPFIINGTVAKFQFFSDSGVAGSGFRAVWTFTGNLR